MPGLRLSPVSSALAADFRAPLSRQAIVLGIVAAAVIGASYFVFFPIEYRHPIDKADVLRETANFLSILAVAVWSRRDVRILNFGFVLLLTSLWMEVFDEFTYEPYWIGTQVPSAIGLTGLVLLAIGLRESARLRTLELDEKRRAEEALDRNHATLRAVIEGSPDAVWVKDLGGAYLLANSATAQQVGVEPGVLVGRRDSELLPPEVAERHAATDREAMQGHAVRYEDSNPPDGSRRTYLVSKGLVRDEHGDAVGILGIARDISDRKAIEERLAHQATHDALTGMPNRPAFLERLSRALGRTQRQPQHGLAVLFIDVDMFKSINDRLGHAAGDEVLVKMAEQLTQWIRPGDYVARFGGDEFTLLLQDVDGIAQAVQVAERILHGLTAPMFTTHGQVNVTVSIGVALSSSTNPVPEEMLRAADAAMYRAKAAGGGRHAVHLAPVPEHRAEA